MTRARELGAVGRPGWIVGRLLAVPLAAWVAAAACFLLLHLVPGSPFDTERLADPALRHHLETAYGLARPWWAQWLDWSQEVLRGNFGVSFQYRGTPVVSLLAQAWPTSLALGGAALVLGLSLALPAAVAVARAPRALVSLTLLRVADALLCLPTFVVAPLLLTAVACSPVPLLGDTPSGRALQFLLASVTLSLPVVAVAFRWTLVGLEEVQGERWWPAILARGLSPQLRWWRYALGAALPKLRGRLAPLTAEVLTGALAVEAVFDKPGLGQLLGKAALHRDSPVLLGAVSCAVVTVMLVQCAADFLSQAPPAVADAPGKSGERAGAGVPWGWWLAGFLLLLASFGPWGSGGDGMSADWTALSAAPGSELAVHGGHWLGTDELGRDAWVRLCLGLRGSLAVAGLAACTAVLLGLVVGMCSGALPNPLAAGVARLLDVVAALPLTLPALVVAAAHGRTVWAVAGVLGALGMVSVARAVRLAWIHASSTPHAAVMRLHGSGRLERLRWVFLPAAVTSALEAGALLLPQLVIAEGMLGFLGLSLPEPALTLGGLLAESSSRLLLAPWGAIAPSVLVFLLLLATRRATA